MMTNRPATDFRIQHLREKLGGLYEFQALLGRGAFAAVYLVRNLRLERLEAFKVLSEAYDHDEAFVRRFIQEAKLVASLDHPNIVKVYDFGEIDGIVWFSMQYVDGPTLRAELTAQGRFSPMTVARLAIPLLDALDYSHQLGTVHRDIKPSNVLLDRRGRPYLMDFGIAKSTANALKTMTGRILGTPAYISPEQVQGEEIDGRADLYSLAIAMYEMQSGQTPFRADDSLQTIVKRLNEDPEPLSVHCFSVDEALEAIVMQAMARHPEDRYPDAGAMRQALVDYLSDQTHSQELILMASAPTPIAIEDLPTTVEDQAVVMSGETQTIVIRQPESEGVAPIAPGRSGTRWAVAIVATLALALAGWYLPGKFGDDPQPPNSPVSEVAESSEGTGESAAEPQQPAEAEAPEPEREGEPEPPEDIEASAPALADSVAAEPPKPQPATASPPPPAQTQTVEAQTVKAAPEPSVAPPPAVVRRPVTPPKILQAMQPDLRAGLAVECAGHAVIVSLRVGEDGQVLRSRVLKAGPEGCTEAARVAAASYIFEPALDVAGQPVAATTTLNIRFSEVKE